MGSPWGHLRVPSPSAEALCRCLFGDFELDQERRQLLRAGRPVPLEPKAYELLSLLVERRPRALSRPQIRDAVWPGVFVSESTLSQSVNSIRQALDDDARRPRFIRTAHGFGYAFCGEARDTTDEQPRPSQVALEPTADPYSPAVELLPAPDSDPPRRFSFRRPWVWFAAAAVLVAAGLSTVRSWWAPPDAAPLVSDTASIAWEERVFRRRRQPPCGVADRAERAKRRLRWIEDLVVRAPASRVGYDRGRSGRQGPDAEARRADRSGGFVIGAGRVPCGRGWTGAGRGHPRWCVSPLARPGERRRHNKAGRHVTDLGAADFEIFEDGRRQEITHCSYVALPRQATPAPRPQAAAGSPIPPPPPAATRLRPERVRRTIASSSTTSACRSGARSRWRGAQAVRGRANGAGRPRRDHPHAGGSERSSNSLRTGRCSTPRSSAYGSTPP